MIGNQGMLKLSKSNVLLVNVGALGVEIAKNIILAGVNSFTLFDLNICEQKDLATQFYINQNHIEQRLTRAEASLEQFQKLNPYVNVSVMQNKEISELADKELLTKYDCVILTEIKDILLAKQINELCRSCGTKFLMADVYGLFSWSFSDFGTSFDVIDQDGEEYSENYIGSIKLGESCVIEVLDRKLHDLEDGDHVQFCEIEGMIQLNEQIATVTVINPYTFSIDIDLNKYDKYKSNGLFKKIKKNRSINFESLEEQLNKPNLMLSDLSETKFLQPHLIHVAMLGLHKNCSKNVDEYLTICNEIANEYEANNSMPLNRDNLKSVCTILYATKGARFPSLCAFLGGIVAQEALKSITNKFTPIIQWFHLDCTELYEGNNDKTSIDLPLQNDRFDNLRECFGGEATVNKLKKLRLFMVGCGAIGCEMLKNYALLGISCDSQGLISITDNDLIEKSNLNRQFLFRQEDIQKSKSISAHKAVLKINPQMNINAHEKKVCPQTEIELFSDEFFKSHDVCVNALGKF